jgi:hypothetical protein
MSCKKGIICIFLSLSSVSFGNSKDKKSDFIHVNEGKYGIKFYHMEYVLTPENTMKPFGENMYGPRIFEISDGQFEVFLKKEKFPIPSLAKNHLILRMPSGNHPSKVALFNAIKLMMESKKGSVKVILELNPYYVPEKKEIKGTNVFFRTAKGEYVDHVD